MQIEKTREYPDDQTAQGMILEAGHRMYEKGYEIENIPMVLLDYSIISSQIRTRPYRLFLNEFFTRIKCFYKIGKLPQWIFWAVKPLMVGLVPRKVLYRLKHRLKR